jgi:hypothetical protein
MLGEDLIKASERGDLDEVNRLLSDDANIAHPNDWVCDIYYIILTNDIIKIIIIY